jgi:hypothetical protein
MCSISPLASFSSSYRRDYKSLYDDLPSYECVYSHLPRTTDKNYVVSWTIINKHLFLFDVGTYISIGCDSFNIDTERIEKFLGMKFSKNDLSIFDKKRYENGVIPARWFSGTLYIKRFPQGFKDADDYEYRNAAFTRLAFEKGILIEEKNVTRMNE